MSGALHEDSTRNRERSTTSAGGAMCSASPVGHLVAPGFRFDFGTASHVMDAELWERFEFEASHTSSGYMTVPTQADPQRDSRAAIAEVRRLSGLTWDQLGRLFGVARRSLHFWASGKPLNAAHEEQLYRVLAALRAVDRGSADANRWLLLHEQDGSIPLDLLINKRWEAFIALVGEGRGRLQKKRGPLSPEAQAARAPVPPDVLADALQDRVHDAPAPRPPKRDA